MAQARLLAHPHEGVREAVRVDRRPYLGREQQAVITPEDARGKPGLGLADEMLMRDGDQFAILRSPRGKPCHWACAQAWVNEHQD